MKKKLKRLSDKFLKWYENNPFLRGVIKIIPWVGEGLDTVLTHYSQDLVNKPPWDDFDTLTKTILEFDAVLLNTVREHKDADPEMVFRGYANSISGFLAEHQIPLDRFLKLITNQSFFNKIYSTIPNPPLSVKVEKNLTSILFNLSDESVQIDHPQLLWDCHCKTPILEEFEIDAIMYTDKDCPIHGHSLGSQIDTFFKKNLTEIEYDGMSFLWKQSDEFWPPSIDTFTMLLDLEKEGVYNQPHSSVLDLGCGTGILGIAIAEKNPHTTSVTLSDWLLTPIVYSSINWFRNNRGANSSKISLLIGLSTRWITKQKIAKFDLALCNPPYLPIPEQFKKIKMSATVAGTELLEHFIEVADEIAFNSYVSFSHLANPEAFSAAEKTGNILTKIGEARLTPFRLPQAFKNTDYISWLIKERGLLYNAKAKHRLWHYLTTYKIEQSTS